MSVSQLRSRFAPSNEYKRPFSWDFASHFRFLLSSPMANQSDILRVLVARVSSNLFIRFLLISGHRAISFDPASASIANQPPSVFAHEAILFISSVAIAKIKYRIVVSLSKFQWSLINRYLFLYSYDDLLLSFITLQSQFPFLTIESCLLYLPRFGTERKLLCTFDSPKIRIQRWQRVSAAFQL